MPIISSDIDAQTGDALDLNTSDEFLVVEVGINVISESGTAIATQFNGTHLLIYGVLEGETGVVLGHAASHDRLYNEASGMIDGLLGPGIFDPGNVDLIVNSGLVTSLAGAILVQGAFDTVYNYGQIDGGSGAGVDLGGIYDTLYNSGEITGATGAQLYSGSALAVTASLTNLGTIVGVGGDAVSTSGKGAFTLINRGTLEGDVALSDGADTIRNSGTILGDVIFGSGDIFNGVGGTVDGTIEGGAGANTFIFAPTDFDNDVALVGGGGNDILRLSAAGTISADGLANVTEIETIELANGKNNIAVSNSLVGSAPNATLNIIGGNGADTIDASAVTNPTYNVNITGGLGADTLIAGGGKETFVYGSAADSSGSNYDTIFNFDVAQDVFDLPVQIAAIDTPILKGNLSTADFNADLGLVLQKNFVHNVDALHAVVFKPNGGNLAGQTFLIVQLKINNVGSGYIPGSDLVIDLNSSAGALTTANFVKG